MLTEFEMMKSDCLVYGMASKYSRTQTKKIRTFKVKALDSKENL